jgi:hypothetical protein
MAVGTLGSVLQESRRCIAGIGYEIRTRRHEGQASTHVQNADAVSVRFPIMAVMISAVEW